jgi:hypothetical protein
MKNHVLHPNKLRQRNPASGLEVRSEIFVDRIPDEEPRVLRRESNRVWRRRR